jgi:hypothetical protein
MTASVRTRTIAPVLGLVGVLLITVILILPL